MNVEKIHEIIKPLQDKLEKFFPEDETYFDLKDAKYINISTLSDVMLKVNLEFSYDGVNKGVLNMVRSTSIWLSQKILAPMRYLRIHIVNESQQPNNNLVIVCRLFGKTKKNKNVVVKSPLIADAHRTRASPVNGLARSRSSSTNDDNFVPPPMIKQGSAIIEHQDVIEEVKNATRPHKSPFARFRKKTDNQQAVKAVPIKDPRLPDYLPAGSILVCGIGSTIKLLPKGNDGEYLMMKDGEPCWTLPYPPNQLSNQSKMRLSQAYGCELDLEEKSPIPEPWIIRES